MNETATSNTDRFRVVVLVLTLINTIFAAALSGLQVDANIRADRANRDSQYYALLAANELVRHGHQSAYDLELFANTVQDTQKALVMEFTALEMQQDGEDKNAAQLLVQSQVAQARADKGTTLSRLYSDPRYAPTEADGIPNLEAYLTDWSKVPNELVAKQNAASDDYHKWNKKADGYVAVLTVIALAFFLLGLAQSTSRMRLFFAVSALVIMFISVAWTGLIMLV
jgi:hypothetical protein